MRENNENIAFFFGAGAESSFGLPLGSQYTTETIMSKRSKMMDALSVFYSQNESTLAQQYQKRSLYTANSNTFRSIVLLALMDMDASNLTNENPLYKQLKVIEKLRKDQKVDDDIYHEILKNDDFHGFVKDIINEIYIDMDTIDQRNNHYKEMLDHFSYYGTIEKDFSTIINPHKAGIVRFWRLINYFWSAYFSILFPTLKLSSKYKNIGESNDYNEVLKELAGISRYIFSDSYKKEIESKMQASYYGIISSKYKSSYAITTNYTPFLSLSDFENTIYLAGKLSQFEVPEELRIVDFSNTQSVVNIDDKILFPYIATQAPVKPIIDYTQLQEYSSFIKVLEEINTLVIIGYNINENDNHINALLRSFVTNDGDAKIIYAHYAKDNDPDCDKEKDKILDKLKINKSEPASGRIIVIANNGDPAKVLSQLS